MLTENKIKKLNDKFKSLSKTEKRVLIARDVIAQVKAEKYFPRRGSYIKYLTLGGDEYDVTTNSMASLQKHFDEITCNCCALGACLLSATKYKNRLEFQDVYNLASSQSPWDLLKGIFSSKQLNMIEYAFEAERSGTRVGENRFKNYLEEEIQVACIDFGRSYDDPEDRMIAIMKNIIKNKGEFKP